MDDYVPIFSKFDRSKYQQQQKSGSSRSISDLGFSGSSKSVFQQKHEALLKQQQEEEEQQHQRKHHQRKSKTMTVSDVSSEVFETPPDSPYSTIKRVSVTPPATLDWNSNPLWNSTKRDKKKDKSDKSPRVEQTTHTSTRELKLSTSSSREGTPQLLSPTCPLTVDTTELDQVLTEMDQNDTEFQYVYKKDKSPPSQNSPAKRPERPRDFGSGSQVFRNLSVDSPEPYSDSNNPDWMMDDGPAPDNTVIKPSKMRESLRRKSKENSPASGDFQRAGFGRSSARETSASPSFSKRSVSERMSLREKRSWRSAEPKINESQTSSAQTKITNSGTAVSSNGYQFLLQQQPPPQQKSSRRRQVRKLTDPTSSEDETTKHTTETNNNYKSHTISSEPSNPYPTLYDNHPHPRTINPSSSFSSHSSSSKQKESLRKGSSRRNTTDATGDYENVSEALYTKLGNLRARNTASPLLPKTSC